MNELEERIKKMEKRIDDIRKNLKGTDNANRDTDAQEKSGDIKLDRVTDDPLTQMIALKWIEFLIDRLGSANLSEILDYYLELGWISEDALMDLEKISDGIKPTHQEADWRPDNRLSPQDHILSLIFIQRIKGKKIDSEITNKLHRIVRNIKKDSDQLFD